MAGKRAGGRPEPGEKTRGKEPVRRLTTKDIVAIVKKHAAFVSKWRELGLALRDLAFYYHSWQHNKESDLRVAGKEVTNVKAKIGKLEKKLGGKRIDLKERRAAERGLVTARRDLNRFQKQLAKVVEKYRDEKGHKMLDMIAAIRKLKNDLSREAIKQEPLLKEILRAIQKGIDDRTIVGQSINRGKLYEEASKHPDFDFTVKKISKRLEEKKELRDKIK